MDKSWVKKRLFMFSKQLDQFLATGGIDRGYSYCNIF